jgi:hypothetical protein
MGQPHEEITEHLAEQLCWEVARRDDSLVACRLSRKPPVDGVYRLDEGALLDDFFHVMQAIGVKDFLQAHSLFPMRPLVGLRNCLSRATTLLRTWIRVTPVVPGSVVSGEYRDCPENSTSESEFSAPLPLTPPTLTAMSRSVRTPLRLPCSSTRSHPTFRSSSN